jgi:hypothetical protein
MVSLQDFTGFFIRKASKKGPKSENVHVDQAVNLDKLISTCPCCLGLFDQAYSGHLD